MALVLLEAFDDPEDACEAVPEGPSEDWLDGHAAGVAEGAACAARDAARRSAELTQALSELGFTLAEARRAVAHAGTSTRRPGWSGRSGRNDVGGGFADGGVVPSATWIRVASSSRE